MDGSYMNETQKQKLKGNVKFENEKEIVIIWIQPVDFCHYAFGLRQPGRGFDVQWKYR